MKKIKEILAIVLIISLLSSFAGCSGNSEGYLQRTSSVEKDNTDYLSVINKTASVKVEEAYYSFSKSYNIYVDDKKIATITGEYVNYDGDVFTLKDVNGKVLAKEKQIRRYGMRLNRLAHVMDANGKTTGYIGEDLIRDWLAWDKYKFHIYDANEKELAYTKEILWSTYNDFEIYDSNTSIYSIREQWSWVDTYLITKNEESNIKMTDVIFLTCIIDAIRDAEEKEKEKEKDKDKDNDDDDDDYDYFDYYWLTQIGGDDINRPQNYIILINL